MKINFSSNRFGKLLWSFAVLGSFFIIPQIEAAIPPAPASLSAYLVQPKEALLSWEPSPGAVTYTIRRSGVRGGPYSILVPGVDRNPYSDGTVLPGTVYYYVISAVNSDGESPPSNEATLVADGPPTIPTGVRTTSEETGVTLTWNSSIGAATYNVKRGLASAGPYTTVGTGISSTTFTDNQNLTPTTTYYYVVSAVKPGPTGTLESGNSQPAIAMTSSPPPHPTGLVASAGLNGEALLSWNPSPGASSYAVKRSLVGGGPYAVLVNSVNDTRYTDNSVTPSTVYYYVVSAANRFGQGQNSTEVKFTQQSPPNIPTGLTAIAGPQQVALSWNPSAGALRYTLKRSLTAGGPYSTAVSALSGTTYTDTGLAPQTTYFYVVTATGSGGGESGFSNEARATVLNPLPRLSVAQQGNNTTLTWTSVEVYTLESSENLTQWTVVPGTRVPGQNTQVLPATSGRSFFRLRFP